MSDLLTLERSLKMQIPSGARLSPDGRTVAFAVTEGAPDDPKAKARTHIWLADVPLAQPRRFTNGPARDFAPSFSPDGQWLYFLSNRHQEGKGKPQLYRIATAGGEAEQLTDRHAAIGEYAVGPDGQSIAFLAANVTEKEPEDPPVRPFETDPHVRLWVLDLATRDVTAVTPADLQVWEFAWSPTGDQFALICSEQPYEWSWYKARVARVAAAGGEVVTLHQSAQQVATPVFSPDGSRIAFLSSIWSDRGLQNGDLYVVSADGGRAANWTAGWAGSVSRMEWEGDRLLFLAHVGLESAFGYAGAGAAPTVLWQGAYGFWPGWQQVFHRSGNRLTAVRESATEPAEVWVAEIGADGLTWSRCTQLNPQLDEIRLGQVCRLTWPSAPYEIEGLLVLPPDYEPGKRYPMVLNVHGGPAASFDHRYRLGQTLAAEGFVVLCPNPRGSVGRGVAFTSANLGDMGGGDFQDLMAGVDAAIAAGYADPDRLAISGGSYGGYMAAWAPTQTDRFKAAVVMAGITNYVSFHGVTNIHTWDEQYIQGNPFTHAGDYVARSPMTHVANLKTPTLILHGDQDACVPVGQAYEWHRALKQRGVPVELMVYPGEGHGVAKPKHVREMTPRVHNWLKKYLA